MARTILVRRPELEIRGDVRAFRLSSDPTGVEAAPGELETNLEQSIGDGDLAAVLIDVSAEGGVQLTTEIERIRAWLESNHYRYYLLRSPPDNAPMAVRKLPAVFSIKALKSMLDAEPVVSFSAEEIAEMDADPISLSSVLKYLKSRGAK